MKSLGRAALLCVLAACAAPPLPRDEASVRADVAERAAPTEAADVSDGLDEDEAAALALWNEPEFDAALAELGFARADLVRAGQIRNPAFSLLFPWGPKQLEAVLTLPAETLWLRDGRIASATLDAEATAERLVARGLDLVRDTRLAFVDALASSASAAARRSVATRRREIVALRERGVRGGDVAPATLRSAVRDAASAEALLAEAEGLAARDAARLARLIGAPDRPIPELRAPDDAPRGPASRDLAMSLRAAETFRPEIRAAELAVDAARARSVAAGGEAFAAAVVVDVNGEGKSGFEAGPGVVVAPPVFDSNDAGKAEAAAKALAATRRERAVRATVAADVVAADAALADAERRLDLARAESAAADRLRDDAVRAVAAGDSDPVAALEARIAADASLERLGLVVRDLRRARIARDRAIGRRLDASTSVPSLRTSP